MSSQQQQPTNEASKFTAIKDQAVGAVKEAIGNVLGNNKMELEGKAQKMHGHNEYQYAKALKEGETEPQKFQQAYHPQDPSQVQESDHIHPTPIAGQAPPPPAEYVQPPAAPLNEFVQPSAGTVPPPVPQHNTESSQMSAWNDQAAGAMKENWGDVTKNPQMEMEGRDQKLHAKNEGRTEHSEASTMSAMKDKTLGSIKETWGSATGNTNAELEGKAQQMHGRNEAEFAKAQKQGLNEPEHYERGTKETHHAEGKVEGDHVSKLGAIKDRAMGSVKETFGTMTGNQNMELKGKAQNIHGKNEAAFAQAQKEGLSEPEHFAHGRKPAEAEGEVVSDKPSKMSGWKDQTVGAMKETFGSATNNPDMELKGKAQSVHGRNEAEFAKAQSQGLAEPEHFSQGMKNERAEGSVEGEKVSSFSAMKDKTLGSIKETWGSATGNTHAELEGKAQQMHGRNEAEFVKAQKQGLNEPEHYERGTKETHHADSKVEGEQVSKLGAIKDRAMGSVKETFGTMTGNQNTELEGKAQQMHGRNEAEFAKAQKEGLREPEHYAHGTKTTDHAQGEVISEEQPSKMSGYKDQAVGSVKESLGNMMNNEKMELEGKAQKMQGSSACSRADAQRNTINA